MLFGLAMLLGIVASGFLSLVGGANFVLGGRLLLAGFCLLVVHIDLDDSERRFLQTRLRPLAAFVVITAAWIVIQILPIRFMANPVWQSARAAVGGPLVGHMALDVGAAVRALLWLTVFSATSILAASVAIDRMRAELLLVALTAMALAMTLFGYAMNSVSETTAAVNAATLDGAAITAILSLACGILAFERFETRYRRHRYGRVMLSVAILLSASAVLLCGLVILMLGSTESYLASGTGLIVVLVVVVARRLSYGWWAGGALAVMFCSMALAVLAPSFPGPGIVGSALVLDPQARIAADAPWVGIGPGSYAAVVWLYAGLGDPAGVTARSDAALLNVEFGRPAFWIVTAAVAVIGLKLLSSALRRGRDSIYATAGAAVMLTSVALGFANTGVVNPAIGMLASAVLGLALAQSQSRVPS